jgi:hypothetical protein
MTTPFASYAWLDVPRPQVSVTFPWYYFGGEMKVTAGEDGAGIPEGRDAGRRWRELLGT